ncbi:MAG TPA: endolytic transglycosylase MltG [Deltaproteobacteria bacterium]|nr:endolytic transglycosylase MltG [Deltaproteobacteria bacterium]
MKTLVHMTCAFTAGVVVVFIIHAYLFLTTPTAPEMPLQIEITPGQSAWEISRLLEHEGIVTDAPMFMALTLASSKYRFLKAGTYIFEGRHLPMEIMEILFRGKTLRYRITIPEGSTIYTIADIITNTGLVTREEFVQSALRAETSSFFDLGAPSVEGFLFPDTYFLSPHMTPLEIMAKMINRFSELYTNDFDVRAEELDMSRIEVLTLASIIEKEAVVHEEKPIISSVFHNRLRKNMPLQADPTVVYGIDGFSRTIRPEDLLRDSPYNTYRIRGLPPGPICNPGIASIRAALWPASTDYLYFVSNRDGTHSFSTSLKEHNRAIRRLYRIRD